MSPIPWRNSRTGSGHCRPGGVHTRPAPGTATRADADRLRAAGHLCELVDGTLIEKAVSFLTSVIASRLIWLLGDLVENEGLGWIGGADGYVDLYGGTLQRGLRTCRSC